jgi:serine/threonine protein kinase
VLPDLNMLTVFENILVFSPRPQWWVKLSDFGISKRLQNSTLLRTMGVGTRGFVAPEVLGLFPAEESEEDGEDEPDGEDGGGAYTFAIDIWALGETVVRMLTGQPTFSQPRELTRYVVSSGPFPLHKLQACGTSDLGCAFVLWTMEPAAKDRPTAEQAASDGWLRAERGIVPGLISQKASQYR